MWNRYSDIGLKRTIQLWKLIPTISFNYDVNNNTLYTFEIEWLWWVFEVTINE